MDTEGEENDNNASSGSEGQQSPLASDDDLDDGTSAQNDPAIAQLLEVSS